MTAATGFSSDPPWDPPKKLKLFSEPPEVAEDEPERLSAGLFAPPSDGQIHRITNPVAANSPDFWESWNDQQRAKYQPKNVPAELRPQYIRQTSVPQFYSDCQPGARWEPMGRKGRSAATIEKDGQALRRWVEGTRPDDWPSNIAWPGPSLEMIEGGNRDLMNDWVACLEMTLTKRGQPLSAGTIGSTWTHLRTILNHAIKVQAITRFPSPSELPEDDETPRFYTDQEIEAIWALLTEAPLLKVALVVSFNTGPRAEDLFCLPFDCIWRDTRDRPHLRFEARKTGKKHLCPLAACVVKAIEFAQRQASSQTLFNDCPPAWLFPGLTNPEVEEPEDSPTAKRRAKKTRVVWDAAGLEDVDKPWQVGRSTCSTRLAAIDREAGKFMIGTGSKDVFTKSYAPPHDSVWRAALAVQQPACFLREFGP